MADRKEIDMYKRIVLFLTVLFILLNCVSCSKDKSREIEGICPDDLYLYQTDSIEQFIDTWKSEWEKEDNMFLVTHEAFDGVEFSEVLLVPQIKDYYVTHARLSKSGTAYSFDLYHKDDLERSSETEIWILISRKVCSTLEKEYLEPKYPNEPIVINDGLYVRKNEHYINLFNMNIRVTLPSSYEFKSADELSEFLNFEVLYP